MPRNAGLSSPCYGCCREDHTCPGCRDPFPLEWHVEISGIKNAGDPICAQRPDLPKRCHEMNGIYVCRFSPGGISPVECAVQHGIDPPICCAGPCGTRYTYSLTFEFAGQEDPRPGVAKVRFIILAQPIAEVRRWFVEWYRYFPVPVDCRDLNGEYLHLIEIIDGNDPPTSNCDLSDCTVTITPVI